MHVSSFPAFLPTLVSALPPLRDRKIYKVLSLDPSNVMKGLEFNGQDAAVELSQIRSLTFSTTCESSFGHTHHIHIHSYTRVLTLSVFLTCTSHDLALSINICLVQLVAVTEGQSNARSCNTAPNGRILAKSKMPLSNSSILLFSRMTCPQSSLSKSK